MRFFFYSFFFLITSLSFGQDLLITKSGDSLYVDLKTKKRFEFITYLDVGNGKIDYRIGTEKVKTYIEDYFVKFTDLMITTDGMILRSDSSLTILNYGDTVRLHEVHPSQIKSITPDYWKDQIPKSHYTYLGSFIEEQQKVLEIDRAKRYDKQFSNSGKFGEISLEEAMMTHCPIDSSAGAFILFDKGEFQYLPSGSGYFFSPGQFSRHLRIKILKPSGTRWGNWTVRSSESGNFNIMVFNLEGDVLVSEKLKAKDHYTEELVNGYYFNKMFIPDVKVGTIIDIQYLSRGMPREWQFQVEIPTLHSEISIEAIPNLRFSYSITGFHPILPIAPNRHWIAKNIPAFHGENFMSHEVNFVSKLNIQMEEASQLNISKTWEGVSKLIWDLIQPNSKNKDLRNFLEGVGALEMAPSEIIDTSFYYLKEKLKWSGVYQAVPFVSIYKPKSLGERIQAGEELNSAEMNLALAYLLEELGVRVLRVALSTRDNGILNPLYPERDKLNHLICYLPDQQIFLDLNDKYAIPGFLPENVLNHQGRIISKDSSAWIDLKTKDMKQVQQVTNITVDENFHVSASVQRRLKEYEYVEWAKVYEELQTDEAYEGTLNELYNFKIEKLNLTDEKGEHYVNQEMTLDLDDQVMVFDNELFIHPILMAEFSNNPFKSESRKYPVDFIYPIKKYYMTTITLPENAMVTSLPKPEAIKLENGFGNFTFVCSSVGNKIQVQYLMDIRKTTYTEVEYYGIKSFFDAISNKLQEQIIIAKNQG
ncbi:DUF3858 domain-containing protein [Marinoscillum sp. 108]|uniref:DUF3858 domain-containing protein n=1 Tax=Marinoscillum sp. 108 TaxID=2653151 RepID=UPI0012F3CA3A|nr:DUF3858 domain-containing protein [Marinoscillum sp. 108]VXD14618.1 conserved hypothetical protein [Marinoscillum sp. 108]